MMQGRTPSPDYPPPSWLVEEESIPFNVGPYIYRLVIPDREIFDENGNRLEGCCVENHRLLVISYTVEPERREEIARHEIFHAWTFHTPAAKDNEELCQLTAMIGIQFDMDLVAAGGRDRLWCLRSQRAPQFGRPLPYTPPAIPTESSRRRDDRRICGGCQTPTMCGDINTSDATAHAPTGRFRVERWFHCAVCSAVIVWHEFSSADGYPLGEFLSVPRPQIIRGDDAERWLADHSEPTTTERLLTTKDR